MDFNASQKLKGIWFYGLAGSGKTYASKLVAKTHPLAFIVDGDEVRKYVSLDLGYSIEDRKVQIKRILGLSIISINNGFFPIASSVLMSDEILTQCKKKFIKVIQINRSREQVLAHREIYMTSTQVVGNDIVQEQLDTPQLFNDGSLNFRQQVLKYAEQI